MAHNHRFAYATSDHRDGSGRYQTDAGGRQNAGMGLSKVERLLGVSEPAGANGQKKSFFDAKRKLRKKKSDIGSTFSDLKGIFSGSSKKSNSHKNQASRSYGDTDSMTSASIASPTFDPAASTSTLPSYYEPPHSPHHGARTAQRFVMDSSPRVDRPPMSSMRSKPHHVLDMPPIQEDQADGIGLRNPTLAPLELPPLSPVSQSTHSKAHSFSPVNRIRTPSNASVASDATAKGGKWLGWRSSKSSPAKEFGSRSHDTLPRSQDHSSARSPRLFSSRPEGNVQKWLDGADLDRRPSAASRPGTDGSKLLNSQESWSPISSSASLRTLTSQPETTNHSPARNRPAQTQREMRPRDSINPTVGNIPAHKMYQTDLQIESVLSLSSSEDGSDDERRVKRRSRNVLEDPRFNPPKQWPHVPLSPKAMRRKQREEFQVNVPAANELVSPYDHVLSSPSRTSSVISSVDLNLPTQRHSRKTWRISNESEQGGLTINTAEPAFKLKKVESPPSTTPTPPGVRTPKPLKPLQTSAPLIENTRDASAKSPAELATENSPSSQRNSGAQALSVTSPSIYSSTSAATSPTHVEVMNFPIPPQSRSASVRSNSLKSTAHSSQEVTPRPSHSELSVPPTVLLTPSMDSRNSLNSSDTSSTNSKVVYGSNGPHELSDTDPDSIITYRPKDFDRKGSMTSGMVIVTGLESVGQLDDEMGDDLKNFVLSSCM